MLGSLGHRSCEARVRFELDRWVSKQGSKGSGFRGRRTFAVGSVIIVAHAAAHSITAHTPCALGRTASGGLARCAKDVARAGEGLSRATTHQVGHKVAACAATAQGKLGSGRCRASLCKLRGEHLESVHGD